MKRYFSLFLVILAFLTIFSIIFVFFNSTKTPSKNVGQLPNAIAATPTVASPTAVAITDETLITLPTALAQNLSELHIRATNLVPSISQRDAMQVVYNFTKQNWALGKNGNTWAQFGLVTIGSSGGAGKPWAGLRNIQVLNCSAGKCQNTGQVLDHIENRPMWILDYGNVDAPSLGVLPCPNCTTTPIPDNNHIVYTVDVQTKTVMGMVRFYRS